MSEPIKVVATFLAKAGKTEELGAALRVVAAATQADQGVIFYHLHQDRKEPRRFVFFESWESQAAIDLHDATPHITTFFAQIPDLVEHAEINQLRQIG